MNMGTWSFIYISSNIITVRITVVRNYGISKFRVTLYITKKLLLDMYRSEKVNLLKNKQNTPVTSVYCYNSRFGSTNLLLFFILAGACTVIIMPVLSWRYMPNVFRLTTLIILSLNSWNLCTHFVYFKSKKERNYDTFVDLNINGAAHLVHSDLRIYRISFFHFDWILVHR